MDTTPLDVFAMDPHSPALGWGAVDGCDGLVFTVHYRAAPDPGFDQGWMRLRFSISHFGRCRRGATGLRRRYGRHMVCPLGSRRIGCPRSSSVFAAHLPWCRRPWWSITRQDLCRRAPDELLSPTWHLDTTGASTGSPTRVRSSVSSGRCGRASCRSCRVTRDLMYSRGISPSRTLSSSWTNWRLCCANGWQLFTTGGPHSGIGGPVLALRLSPAQMFEHGISRWIPRGASRSLPGLPIPGGAVAHHPALLASRSTGAITGDRRASSYVAREKSPFSEKGGRWPVHVDPDDVRQVYFADLKTTKQWHALAWTEAAMCDGPMNEDGLPLRARVGEKQAPVRR